MSLRIGVLLIAIGVLAAAECPALAASQGDWDACKSQDPDTTIAGCTRVLDAGDETPKVHSTVYNARGIAYKRKGDYDRAIVDYDEAIRLDPNNARAYSNRGNAYADKGDYDRAIADYDEAIRLDPKFARAYSNRGNAYDGKGDYDRAIADYDEAIRLDPN
jgi:tetratricopeptide (TPR) repeat protein